MVNNTERPSNYFYKHALLLGRKVEKILKSQQCSELTEEMNIYRTTSLRHTKISTLKYGINNIGIQSTPDILVYYFLGFPYSKCVNGTLRGSRFYSSIETLFSATRDQTENKVKNSYVRYPLKQLRKSYLLTRRNKKYIKEIKKMCLLISYFRIALQLMSSTITTIYITIYVIIYLQVNKRLVTFHTYRKYSAPQGQRKT